MAFRKNGRNELIIWADVMEKLKMVDTREPSERTKLEMEAGRKAVMLYDKLQKIETSENLLKNAFPSLVIGTTIKPPYTHVTLRARGKGDVIMQIDTEDGKIYVSNLERYGGKWQRELEFTEPILEFPSDHLVAQLALIA